MKIISYDPKEIKNVPAFFNKYLDEFKDEDYLMFVFNDINEKIIDRNDFSIKYVTLMKIFELPYVFFPYYIHFNKILYDSICMPCPRAHVTFSKGIFDIIANPAYGMLIVDIQKLKSINFKFNEEYKLSFYIQDLIHACYENKLWISETYFLDLCNSYSLLTENIKKGYSIPPNDFNAEKKKFFDNVKIQNEDVNAFIKELKKKFGSPEVESPIEENTEEKKEEETAPAEIPVEMPAESEEETEVPEVKEIEE